ncbi:MAG: hypothetical protein KGH57_00615 [Candidatus Micrarchaeota archaeon]|nr:hypothetical protein [Candidatus Micrarchaeota archaeon]
MQPLLLIAGCDFPTLFGTSSGWLGINVLVVLLSVTVGGLAYAVSNLLPTDRAERLKGITRYELFEAFMSIIIVFAIFTLASLSCNVGAQLSPVAGQQDYTSLFRLSNAYLGSLLFTNGVSEASNLYSVSTNYVVASNLILIIEDQFQGFVSELFAQSQFLGLISVEPGEAIEFILLSYSGAVTGVYAALLMVSFAPLFILFLILPMIQAAALTVVVPVALIMRSLSFVGPKIRETSNLFLALAIGFYFVLPLTIAFNVYMASCMNIGLVSSLNVQCSYPLPSSVQVLLTPYQLPQAPSTLFSSQGQSLVLNNVPYLSQGFNLLGAYGLNPGTAFPGAQNILSYIWNAPTLTAQQGESIAVYLYLGIVLIAVDMAITVGFINGIGKGLNSLSGLFGTEPLLG